MRFRRDNGSRRKGRRSEMHVPSAAACVEACDVGALALYGTEKACRWNWTDGRVSGYFLNSEGNPGLCLS